MLCGTVRTCTHFDTHVQLKFGAEAPTSRPDVRPITDFLRAPPNLDEAQSIESEFGAPAVESEALTTEGCSSDAESVELEIPQQPTSPPSALDLDSSAAVSSPARSSDARHPRAWVNVEGTKK